MPYTDTFDIHLGSGRAGLTLQAQIVDTSGVNIGGPITTGFVELGGGDYLWTYTGFPDGVFGAVEFYSNGGTVFQASGELDPSGLSVIASGGVQGIGTQRTFLDLQNEALGDDFDPMKYRTLAKQFINEALHRVARRVRLGQLEQTYAFTTAPGVATYALPGSEIQALSLRNTTDRQPLDDVGIDAIDSAAAAQGKPDSYAFFTGQLTLYPTPDGTYGLELRYRANTASLVGDGEVPAMPADYQDLLVSWARYKLFRAEDDRDMAAFYLAEYERELQMMRADVQLQNRGRVRRIPGMFDRPATPNFQRP